MLILDHHVDSNNTNKLNQSATNYVDIWWLWWLRLQCFNEGDDKIFDVQAQMAELQRRLDLLWTSPPLNAWTFEHTNFWSFEDLNLRTFKPSESYFVSSETLWFCNTYNSASICYLPDSISSSTQIIQCYQWTFHAHKCDFLSRQNPPMLSCDQIS